jgi:fluoroacetyl-CoA thioesterase
MLGAPLAWLPVKLSTGLRGDAKLIVTEAETARALGSGTVEVLGTPRVVALVEEATCAALEGVLEPGTTSVGMRVQLDHLQPTPVGGQVDAEAVLEKIEGRRLTFTVSAYDAGGLVAAGKVTRVIVEVDRFMKKCCE